MENRVLYFTKTIKIIIFNSVQPYQTFSVGNSYLTHGLNGTNKFLETQFRCNEKLAYYKMFGRLTEITEEKMGTFLKKCGYEKNGLYKDFTNDVYTLTALESMSTFLKQEQWEYSPNLTWIIIPKPALKLVGTKFEVEFTMSSEDFKNPFVPTLLTVYSTKFTPKIKNIDFSVEIPDFLYDFVMLADDIEARPKSKVIKSANFSDLQKTLTDISQLAYGIVSRDEWIKKAKKVIVIRFDSSTREVRDEYNHGFAGNKTTISYQYYIAFKVVERLNNRIYYYVEKSWTSTYGFKKTEKGGRMAVVTQNNGVEIEWTEEREEFLNKLENNFINLSKNLNTYLSDINAESLDKLIGDNSQILLNK